MLVALDDINTFRSQGMSLEDCDYDLHLTNEIFNIGEFHPGNDVDVANR